MEITEAQDERIKRTPPVQRVNVRLSNLQVGSSDGSGFRRIFPRFETLDMLFLGFLNFALIIEALR